MTFEGAKGGICPISLITAPRPAHSPLPHQPEYPSALPPSTPPEHTMRIAPPTLPALALLLQLQLQLQLQLREAHAFTPDAEMARLQLQQALYSPSGKLTLSPEIDVPEPTDPTAILLQASEVAKMSERVRVGAKANAAYLSGSVNALRSFATEQEGARGNFPGPVPLIYCGEGAGDESSMCDGERLGEVAAAGALGVLLPVLGGKEVESVGTVAGDTALGDAFRAALGAGLQGIPEVHVAAAAVEDWGEEEMTALVAALAEVCGAEPASVVVTITGGDEDEDGTDAEGAEDAADDSEDDQKPPPSATVLADVPRVPKALGKKVPIIASIDVAAGGGRMGQSVAVLKEAGFTGAFLRKGCVPGLTSSVQDLEFVGGFWSAAIGDLKSVKSKNFGFRAKIARPGLDRDLPGEWLKYQTAMIESGALGGGDEVGPSGGGDLDSDAGDYKGF